MVEILNCEEGEVENNFEMRFRGDRNFGNRLLIG